MAALLVVFFPVGLLLFLLFMERVEAPLRRADDPEEMERFLESAKQEDVDNIISGGLRKAMKVWRRRLTGGKQRDSRSGTTSSHEPSSDATASDKQPSADTHTASAATRDDG